MLYALTGATGFIGSALARQLRAAGHEVRALVRDPARAAHLNALGATPCRGDLSDRQALLNAVDGADGIFHVAGWYKVGVADERGAVATNVEGTRNVLAAARTMHVGRVVYTSTLAVNSDTRGRLVDETYQFRGRHLSVYDRTKAEAHEIALAAAADGLPVVIVQPGLVYGPADTSSIGTMFRRFLRRTLPPVPSGTAFCWAHVDDIANGHTLAMERGVDGRAYFLAGPPHTLVEALDIASMLTGISAPRHVSPSALSVGATLASLIERVVSLPPEFTSEGLRVLAGTTYLGSSARAREELGWHARPLKDGLGETLAYERERLGMV
jgi:dihydroflavonol-4-reductase